jgi:hypothetical protein
MIPLRRIPLMMAVLGVVTLLLAAPFASAQSEPVELTFVPHIAIGAAEQDVLLPDEDGALWRVSPDTPISSLSQPLFASTTGAEHDPFQVNESPLGPYEQGTELGFTLGQWLAASGSGTYTVNGDTAMLEASFNNLVPNGVYTMWCSRVFLPPEFEIRNYPCGEPVRTENTFVADEDGNATFSLEIPVMEDSTDEVLSLFAINYHSDGNTYGADPGNFGFNAHVQLLAPVPPPMSE